MAQSSFTNVHGHQSYISPQHGLDQRLYLIKVAQSNLSPSYLEATRTYLEQHFGIIETLTAQVVQVALKLYPTQLQSDLKTITQTIRQWLETVFNHSLWEPLSQEVWVNVLTWTVQDLEIAIAESLIQAVAQKPFYAQTWQLLFDLEKSALGSFLSGLEDKICQDLIAQILHSPQALEPFLWGLPFETIASAVTLPTLVIPSYVALEASEQIASASSASAGSSPSDPDATFWPPQGSLGQAITKAITLEHYLTRPSELYRLPWELIAQVRQQCGLPMVQLLCLLAGHALRQPHPAKSTFTLTEREILEQLDWQLPQQVPPPDLGDLLGQLSKLTITSIWMSELSTAQVESFNTHGYPWDILRETQGSFDWTSGRITEPKETFITVRPGLWLHHLLVQGGFDARCACEAFGRFSLKLLQLDYCRDSFLISLLIALGLSAPQPQSGTQLLSYTIRHLLDATLQDSVLQVFQAEPDLAPALFKVWNQALEALLRLGWSGPQGTAEAAGGFYLAPYPDWLKSASPHSRKPPDWVEQWLAQPLQMMPPLDLMSLRPTPRLDAAAPSQLSYSSTVGPTALPLRRLRFNRLTGAEVRSARKAKRLTQAQLAEVIHVHQSLIAKIEAGRRTVTVQLESSLRQALQL